MAITTIIKRLLGVEDVNWDQDGSDSRFPVETSTGGTRSVKRVNASDIPSTTAAREKKRIGGIATTGSKDVDGHLQEIYDDLNKIGVPDGTTLKLVEGELKVGTITASEIGVDAVDTAEIKANAVKTDELNDGAVTTVKLDQTDGEQAVTSATIRDKAVGTDKLDDLAVDEEKIGDSQVTPGKMGMDGSSGTFSHYIALAGEFSVGSSVNGTDIIEDVPGLLSSDIVFAQVSSKHGDYDAFLTYCRPVADENAKLEFRTQSLSGATHLEFQFMAFRACVT